MKFNYTLPDDWKFYSNYSDHHHQNKTLHWFSSDNEKYYEKHCKDSKSKQALIDLGWYPNPGIDYKFNSFAFRADEFIDDENPSLMTLGCSHTMGVGIRYEDTFSYILSRKLKHKNYNLGNFGASNDTAFRYAYYWIPKLKPTAVLLMSPEYTRCEMFNNVYYHNYVLGTEVKYPKFNLLSLWYKRYYIQKENCMMNHLKNINAIMNICKENNVPLYIENASDYFNKNKAKDYARDLAHFGPKTNKKVADILYNKYFQNV